MTMRLSELKRGHKGTIIKIRGGSRDHHRLIGIGITVGCEVEMLGITPLGEPFEVRVKGRNLALRQREAEHIKVKLFQEN
jgi:ferrous iron transport protein A